MLRVYHLVAQITIARLSGSCALSLSFSGAVVFKGGVDENSTLQQTITPTGTTFAIGDTLDLTLWVNGKSSAAGKVKLKVTYGDGTLPEKFSQNLPTMGVYTEVSRRVVVNSASVSAIKVQVKHQSAAGKVYVDEVSVLHRVGSGRLPLP